MLLVLTGPVRSGKSSAGFSLALASGSPITIAVGGRADDAEMERRIARHQQSRPLEITIVEADAAGEWLSRVPDGECLVVDCLGTVLGNSIARCDSWEGDVAGPDAEACAESVADVLVAAILAREGRTIVISNETGWGVVPVTPLGRVFRDVLGRATRELIDHADGAWLVVAGRCIDLLAHPPEATWPIT